MTRLSLYRMRLLVCVAASALVIMISASCMAAPFSAGEAILTSVPALVATPTSFDEKPVVVEGEVIGKPLNTSAGTWVNLGDQGSAVGVFCQAELTRGISVYGDWRNTGDRVRVTGVFRVASPAQQGETHLEAVSLELVSRGQPRVNPVNSSRVYMAIGLLVLCAVVVQAAWTKHAGNLRTAK